MGKPMDRSDRVFAGPLKSFEQVLPQFEDVRVEYTEFEFARLLGKRFHSVRQEGALIRCGNARCYRGGFELDFKIHEMVRQGIQELEVELSCPGDEGTPKRRQGRPCARSIKALIKLIPKVKKEAESKAVPSSGKD